MFKFNFIPELDCDVVTKDSKHNLTKPTQFEDVVPSSYAPSLEVYKDACEVVKLKDFTIKYIDSCIVLRKIAKLTSSSKIVKAEKEHSDLISGEYEGGGKVWECTNDLLAFLDKNYQKQFFKDKTVLDMGCGCGLLGIYVSQYGATVHFQDFNKEILTDITIPNFLLNKLESNLPIESLPKFVSGSWEQFAVNMEGKVYDIILASETIYNTETYKSILETFKRTLKPDGIVLLAAKSHYFGVGGGLRIFESTLKADGSFTTKRVWNLGSGVEREIIEINLK